LPRSSERRALATKRRRPSGRMRSSRGQFVNAAFTARREFAKRAGRGGLGLLLDPFPASRFYTSGHARGKIAPFHPISEVRSRSFALLVAGVGSVGNRATAIPARRL
jgi:hypothetical protein